jgi:hypothetical protein
MKKQKLKADESKLLAEYEATINAFVTAFLAVGRALRAIRDRALYREDYRDFESYLAKRWDMSRVHAWRLIGAADVVDDLLPIGNILPATESQARPLVPLNKKQRVEAWEEVLRATEGLRITAVIIANIVEKYMEAKGLIEPTQRNEDVYSQIPKVKKVIEKMRHKEGYEDFCRELEADLKGLVDRAMQTYEAAMREWKHAA